MKASLSSISTEPAPGATSRASSIRLLSISESSSSSSTLASSASSSCQRKASMTLHFSLRPIFDQALRRVITTSLSTNSTGTSASSAASIAARSSAPGFSPEATPIRRCSAARADCRRIMCDLPSLRILSKSSFSRASGSRREAFLDSHSSTATKSGLQSSICWRTSATEVLLIWAVPTSRRSSSISTTFFTLPSDTESELIHSPPALTSQQTYPRARRRRGP